MKLLYISTPSFADCDFPLIRTFQEKGIDVTYLILLPPFSLRSTLVDIKTQIPKTQILNAIEYPEFRVFENYMDLSKVYLSNRINKKSYSWSYFKETFLLWRFIRKGKYDVVHFDSFWGKTRRFLYKANRNWITTFHDPFPHLGEDRRDQVNSYKRAIINSKGIVLLNEVQKTEFCKLYGVDEKIVLTNRLGIYDNIRTFVKPSVVERKNNVLFFGRISPYKGIEYLCEAMKLVRQEILDATLTIAGGGKMYFDIEPYEQLGYIEVKNHYVDMTELAELLVQCRVCVCPYIDATQSGVIMTSFSLNKPVIATNVGGLFEMIDHEKSGLLVEPQNANDLANAIVKLLRNRHLQQSMAEYIFSEYNEGERSWSSIADKYIDYYRLCHR